MDKIQTWWQSIGPEAQTYVRNGGVLLAAVVGGSFIGWLVTRILTARNFDEVLRAPNSKAPETDNKRGFTASFILGALVCISIWSGAGWWFAKQSGNVEWASTIQWVVKRTWSVVGVLLAALALGGLVARRLVECLTTPTEDDTMSMPAPKGSLPGRLSLAGVVSAISYLLVLLLVLLTLADSFNWPLTRSAAQALWQFAQHAFIAAAAFFLGCLGARWAQDLMNDDTEIAPEKRPGKYVALGIMASTTLLAVAVLLSSANLLLAVATLAIVGAGLYVLRDYLPDVTAGMQLRSHKVREVWLKGQAWQLANVGLVSTLVERLGEFHRVQNRYVLEVCMTGGPAATPGTEPTTNQATEQAANQTVHH